MRDVKRLPPPKRKARTMVRAPLFPPRGALFLRGGTVLPPPAGGGRTIDGNFAVADNVNAALASQQN